MRTAFSRVLLLPAGPPAAPLLPEELGRLGFGARRVDGCVVAPVLADFPTSMVRTPSSVSYQVLYLSPTLLATLSIWKEMRMPLSKPMPNVRKYLKTALRNIKDLFSIQRVTQPLQSFQVQ